MSTIYTRAGKGSPLEWAELDANFTNLNTDKVEKTAADITGGTINNTVIGGTTPAAGTFTTLTAQNETLKGTGNNLFLYSQDFSNANWNKANSSISGTLFTAPDATTTANSLIESSATGLHYVQQFSPTLVSGNTYTISVYLKSGTRTWGYIGLPSGVFGATSAYFNLSTGAVGTVVGGTAAITSVGSGWYRCSITKAATAGAGGNILVATATADNTVSYAGDGTSNILVWGAQLEIGTSAFNYIPTTTTAVYGTPTLSFSGVASIGLQSDGSLYETSAGTGNVRFYTNNIGQEQARVSHTASAVNYVELTGAQIANAPTISSKGSDTNISFAYSSKGTGGHDFYTAGASFTRQFTVAHTASAVNFLQVAGGSTGNYPSILGTGSDASVGLQLAGKGGTIDFRNNGVSTAVQFSVAFTSSSVNYLSATGSGVSGNAPRLYAVGSDTNIAQVFQSKGTGAIDLAAGSSGVNISNGGTVTAITRTAGGGTYTSKPTIAISAPTTAGGVQATASVSFMNSNIATVQAGGTGYTVGDVLTVVGGTVVTTATQFTVATVSAGVVTSVGTPTGTNYSVLPTNPVSTTGGTGTGCTLNLTWGVATPISVDTAGSGYVEQPTVTFSGGGGSGAAAYATVGSGTLVQSIGSTMSFRTPSGEALRLFDAGGTGVNYLGVQGRSAGNGPLITAQGSDTNIFLGVSSKGTSQIGFYTNNVAQEQFRVTHTASAVNYVQVTGATTTSSPIISAQGSDTNAGLIITSKGTSGLLFRTQNNTYTQFRIGDTSGVNYLQVVGASTTNGPVLSAQGSDTNIDLNLTPKGTGNVVANVNSGTFTIGRDSASNAIKLTAPNQNLYVQSSGGGVILFNTSDGSTLNQMRITSTASVVNYLNVTGGATGVAPVVSALGSDTNIDLNLTTKGTGAVNLNTGGGTQFSVANTASATNYFATTGSNGGTPALYSVGASTNIGANFVSKGTGSLAFYTNGSVAQLNIAHTASAVNYLQATGGATGSGVTLSAQGSDTNIDINLVPKGTGSTVYTGGVTINGTLTAQNEVLKGTGQNAFVYSQDYTQANWGLSAVTISTGFTDPLGGSTAQLIAETTATSTHTIGQTPSSLILGNTYTFSVYLKAGLRTYALFGNSSHAISVNLTTGVAISAVGSPLNIASTNAGNGWYRVSFSVATSSNAIFVYSSTDGVFANRSYTGVAGSGVYAWGAQAEFGSTLNTYVPTTTTAVYGTPTLSFSGVSTIGLQSDGSLFVQPAGTGALQAAPTTSTAVGGNARGANAVDWQTARGTASQVASGSYSVLTGGVNNYSQTYTSFVGSGSTNSAQTNSFTSIVAGNSNTASGLYGAVVNGYVNVASGYFSFIGNGQSNSTPSVSAVTTQSATMNGTTAVTLSGSNASIKVGQLITGTSITSYTYVAAISGTSLTLSQAASGSSTSTLSFFTPHGVVVGGGNNQATGAYSVILGGGDAGTAANRNVASGDWSFVGGGRRNTASGISSFVGGGGVYIGAPQTNFGHTASGPHSAIVGGLGNVASGESSFVGGGYGNSASNTYSTVVGGTINTANGTGSSILGGYYGTARSINGYMVFSACVAPIVGSSGVSQSGLLILAKETTTATPTVLTSDLNASASTTNQIILPNNAAFAFKGTVIANVTGAANGAAWEFTGAIMRGANAASTVLMGTPAINRVAATAGATAWAIAITADTTNGGLAVTVTGAASTTIRWVCKAETTEVTF